MVVIGEITMENPLEMGFVEDNDMIQTLPADTTDDALDIGIFAKGSAVR